MVAMEGSAEGGFGVVATARLTWLAGWPYGHVTGSWFVVPGAGTGELTGLRGDGGFDAPLGQHAEARIDYWFS